MKVEYLLFKGMGMENKGLPLRDESVELHYLVDNMTSHSFLLSSFSEG